MNHVTYAAVSALGPQATPHPPSSPAVVVAVVLAYLVFVGLIIFLAVRWGRRRTAATDAAMVEALEASGGRQVSTRSPGGYYTGTVREFDFGRQRVLARVYAVSRYHYRVSLGVASPPLPAVTIIPEGLVDRLGKAIGLNREVQTGDQVFDDAAYIGTVEEDEPVQQALASPAVREGVRRLLELGYKVQLSRGGLEAFQLVPYGTRPDLSNVSEAVARLGDIARALPRLDEATFRGSFPVLWARMIGFLVAWMPALLLAGAIDLATRSPGARTLDGGHKTLIVGLGALTVWLVYVLCLALWLRGRSYAFRALLFGGLLGLAGPPALGVTGTLGLNQALDGSPAEDHVAAVTRTSRYKSDCRLYVTSWIDPSTEARLPVSCKRLAALPAGTEVHIRSHEGALGMPWVEPLQLP
jgi:hypothetical protein